MEHEHGSRTRTRRDFQNKTYINKYRKRASKYRIHKIMNELPRYLRDINNITRFKNNLERFLIEKKRC